MHPAPPPLLNLTFSAIFPASKALLSRAGHHVMQSTLLYIMLPSIGTENTVSAIMSAYRVAWRPIASARTDYHLGGVKARSRTGSVVSVMVWLPILICTRM